MSIIQRSNKSKPFPPNEYLKMIIELNILELLSRQYNDRFVVFGYYKRHVNIGGNLVKYTIMRIRSESGRTHAVLFDFMVPYHRISSDDLTAVISGDTDELSYYSESYIGYLTDIIKLKGITDYISACRAFCRGHCIDKPENLIVML